ncbi:MAG TPA: cob(I)yrinic acid a,c-diamide adenosyltransferase [Vicinamibacterales bacterium]|nr:cob(I)yrinic acid a,c-diamide adenosyltransferase [Vicinamibacterales bacterium]
MKIYTRTGDTGETSLFGGTRVAKNDARVAAYGDVDELNAHLGLARASAPDADIDGELVRLQRDLFALGAQLADPSGTVATKIPKAVLGAGDVERMEQVIDRLEAGLPALTNFILAGGSPCGATLHVARAVCRRAERSMVSLDPAVDPLLLKYINRLSDLLFVLARAANQRAGAPEMQW